MRKIIKFCLILALFGHILSRTCPAGHTNKYNEQTKIFECVSCPEGCTKCSSFNGDVICHSCREMNNRAYFMDENRVCKKCVLGCENCTGPTIAQCSFPSRGYFYKNSSRSLEKCPEGCNRCNQKGECLNCLRSHKSVKIDEDHGSELVTCKKCKADNCAYCKDQQEFQALKEEVCTSCFNGFGKVGKDSCIACPPYCTFCGTDPKTCLVCAEGFTVDENDRSKCILKADKACMNFDSTGKSCTNCKFGYFLDKTKYSEPNKLGCSDCSEITSGCTYCRKIREGEYSKNSAVIEKFRNEVRCSGCAGGFHVDEETGGCIKNPDFCSSFYKQKCQRCIPGYRLIDGACKKIDLENCKEEMKQGTCSLCHIGYFLNESGKCVKCNPSCLSCNGSSDTQCTRCPITGYKIVYDDKKNKSHHFWSLTTYKCVQTCPATDGEFKYLVDEFNRTCVLTKEKAPKKKDESRYPFLRTTDKPISDATLLFDTIAMVKQLKQYITEDIKLNGIEDWKLKLNNDKQCSFKGKIKENLSVEKETFFECACDEDAFGTRCQFRKELYDTVNKFITHILKDVESHNIEEHSLISIIKSLNRSPVNKYNLDKMVEIMTKIQSFRSLYVHEMKSYLSTLDFVIQNYFEIIQEHKRKTGANRDIDSLQEEKMIFRSIREILFYSEEVVRSNLYNKFDLKGAPTYSIQVGKFSNVEDLEKGKSELFIPSPFIDTSSDRLSEIRLTAFLPSLVEFNKNSVALFWGLSQELFKEPSEGFYATNIVKFKLYSHKDYTKELEPIDDGKNKIEIVFPLRVQPAETNLKKCLKCVRLHFGNADTHELKYHDIVNTEVDRAGKVTVRCRFKNLDFHNDYYTVIYDGDYSNGKSDKRYQHMMEGTDVYQFDDYKPPKFGSIYTTIGIVFIGILSLLIG